MNYNIPDLRKCIFYSFLLVIGLYGFVYSVDIPDIQPEIVPFKQIDSTILNLHVFRPAEMSDQPTPAIVFFFGGGWVRGTAEHFYAQSKYLAGRGMVAICAEYRVRNVHGTSPYVCVADAKSAVRWIRLHADELGIGPEMLAAGGGSAGGHLAASTAIVPGFDEPEEILSVSCVPNALVLFNPVIDASEKGYGHELCGDRWREISPAHLVRPGLPPTIVFHGTGDKTVPFENAQRFERLMKEQNNSCTLYPYADMDHGFFNPGQHDDKYFNDTIEKMDAFLVKLGYLK